MTRMLQLIPTGTPAILPSRMFCSILVATGVLAAAIAGRRPLVQYVDRSVTPVGPNGPRKKRRLGAGVNRHRRRATPFIEGMDCSLLVGAAVVGLSAVLVMIGRPARARRATKEPAPYRPSPRQRIGTSGPSVAALGATRWAKTGIEGCRQHNRTEETDGTSA